MVDFISSLGTSLGHVEGVQFHQFPSLERLSLVSEKEFRDAGFGYRAKYLTNAINALESKPGGGVEWLMSLRKVDLQEALEALCTLPGVGPKVAACIALFSLDHHHAIPVDTHVWQTYLSEISSVAEIFRSYISDDGKLMLKMGFHIPFRKFAELSRFALRLLTHVFTIMQELIYDVNN